MTEILTSEEQNVLANYHLNLASNYINEIIREIHSVAKEPDLNKVYELEKAFSREMEIAKHYKQDEGINEDNR